MESGKKDRPGPSVGTRSEKNLRQQILEVIYSQPTESVMNRPTRLWTVPQIVQALIKRGYIKKVKSEGDAQHIRKPHERTERIGGIYKACSALVREGVLIEESHKRRPGKRGRPQVVYRIRDEPPIDIAILNAMTLCTMAGVLVGRDSLSLGLEIQEAKNIVLEEVVARTWKEVREHSLLKEHMPKNSTMDLPCWIDRSPGTLDAEGGVVGNVPLVQDSDGFWTVAPPDIDSDKVIHIPIHRIGNTGELRNFLRRMLSTK